LGPSRQLKMILVSNKTRHESPNCDRTYQLASPMATSSLCVDSRRLGGLCTLALDPRHAGNPCSQLGALWFQHFGGGDERRYLPGVSGPVAKGKRRTSSIHHSICGFRHYYQPDDSGSSGRGGHSVAGAGCTSTCGDRGAARPDLAWPAARGGIEPYPVHHPGPTRKSEGYP
jgi:hypothetical protein